MQPFENDRRIFQEREQVEQLENCKALLRKKQNRCWSESILFKVKSLL